MHILKTESSADDCPKACQRNIKNVCGSDGKTYANDCVLRMARCKEGGNASLTKANDGPCGIYLLI